MDYTISVLDKCREYGFRVYMDPHQDTVRFTFFSFQSPLSFFSGPASLEVLVLPTGL